MKNIILQIQIPEAMLQSLVEEQVKQLIRERAEQLLNADPIFNSEEAAAYLKITTSTLHKKCHLKEIPHSKNGSRLLFRKSELDEMIRQGRKKTGAELDTMAANYTMQRSAVF